MNNIIIDNNNKNVIYILNLWRFYKTYEIFVI